MKFEDYFVVDPESPTGLRWREDVGRMYVKQSNSKAGKPAGVKRIIEGRVDQIVLVLLGKIHVVSKIIWEMVHGPIPEGMIIDHLDGNPFNNKIDNLALKTYAGNAKNRKKFKNNTSGTVGVRRSGRAWVGAYQDENQKTVKRSFSVLKYGCKGAYDLALQFRLDGLVRMNQILDFGYTDRHINGE